MADELITITAMNGGAMNITTANGGQRIAVPMLGSSWVAPSSESGPSIVQLRRVNRTLEVMFEDGTKKMCTPFLGGVWSVIGSGGGPGPGTGDLIDWWTLTMGQGAFGDWESHASYSRGGTDWSTPMGFPLKAPAAGTVRNYPNEDAAGLKTMIIFDRTYPRLVPASPTLMNGVYYENPTAPAVAFMAQHLDSQTPERHVEQGEVFAYSGNTAGPGATGDTHLHAQLLASDSVGADRLDFMKFRTKEL